MMERCLYQHLMDPGVLQQFTEQVKVLLNIISEQKDSVDPDPQVVSMLCSVCVCVSLSFS